MSAADSSAVSILSGLYLAGAGLVLLGVILEGADIFFRKRAAWKRRRRVIEPWLELPQEEKVSPWKHAIGDLGWGILVFGLALEIPTDHWIDGIKDRHIATLTTNLESAVTLAAAAHERAVLAESELAKLQLLAQWRTITRAQETNLIDLLKPVAISIPEGQKKVRVSVDGVNNPESQRYASRIAEVLSKCGFEVQRGGQNIGTKGDAEGLLIEVKNRTNLPPHALPIFEAFRTIASTNWLKATQNPKIGDAQAVDVWILPKPEQ